MSRDRILVIGDVIIDEYNYGKPLGLSAETPTIVADLQKQETFIGGAGLVVRHLLRLGAKVDLITNIGANEKSLYSLICDSSDPFAGDVGVDSDEGERFFCEPIRVVQWQTTRKIRNFVGSYKILQYDVRNTVQLDDDVRKRLIIQFRGFLSYAKKVVICDNRHGVIDELLAKHIVKECKKANVPVFVDSQCSQHGPNYEWYRGADVFFMNEHELELQARALVGLADTTSVTRWLQAERILCKEGPMGATEFWTTGASSSVPGEKVATVDTCGAGDAFLAAYVVTDSLRLANHWAALSTTYLGTIVPKEKLNG